MEMYKMLETEDAERMLIEIEMGMRVDEILADVSNGQEDETASATGTINGGELDPSRAQELVSEIEKHMESVDPKSPSCCIDGRSCVHTLEGGPTDSRASVAGGALITAYAAAELVGWFGNDDSDVAVRLGRINRMLRANGINPGNHCDELAVQNQFVNPDTKKPVTGCGADDRLPEIMAKPYENEQAVNKLVKPLMGEEYNENLKLVPKEEIENKTKQWDPTDVVDAIGNGEAIEVLESKPGEPNHGHREMGVLFNYKDNTSLNRDAFVRNTGEQIFVVDMWYIDKLATALAGGPNAVEQRQQLKQAMVAYQVATYLALCDGSQRVFFAK